MEQEPLASSHTGDSPKKKKHYLILIVASYALVAVVFAIKGKLPGNVLALAGFLGGGLGVALLPLIAMRFGGNIAGWITFAIFGLAYSQGELNWLDQNQQSSTTNAHPYRSNGCEYAVAFPTQPSVKTFTHPQVGDYDQALWTSNVSEDSTALRTECISIAPFTPSIQQLGHKKFMLEQLETFANNNGLTSVDYSYVETPLGHVGSARGVKSIQGAPVTYVIVAVAGKESFLTLYAGGRSATFPQKEIYPFIDSISR